MSEAQNLVVIDFYGDQVYLAEVNGEPYVPVKPICENLGVDWARQYTKLKDDRRWNCCLMPIVAQDGKLREMLCIPLRKLPAWLYSISPEKVKEEIKDKLIRYQEECDEVLWKYWIGKLRRTTAYRFPRTVEELKELIENDPFYGDLFDDLLNLYKRKLKDEMSRVFEREIWSKLIKHFYAIIEISTTEKVNLETMAKIVEGHRIGFKETELAKAFDLEVAQVKKVIRLFKKVGLYDRIEIKGMRDVRVSIKEVLYECDPRLYWERLNRSILV